MNIQMELVLEVDFYKTYNFIKINSKIMCKLTSENYSVE